MHSDLSMNNMLVHEDGRVAIADFGTAHGCVDLVYPSERTVTTITRPPEAWVKKVHCAWRERNPQFRSKIVLGLVFSFVWPFSDPRTRKIINKS